MSALQLLVTALCLITPLSLCDTAYVNENRYSDWTEAPTTANPESFCSRQYSCVNCTTTRVCAPTPDGRHLKEMSQTTCPTGSPWCDPERGVCTDTMSQGCGTPPHEATDFTCMRDGYFPNMTDCSRYYLCSGGSAVEYSCPSSRPYYWPGQQTCYSYNYYCANISDICSGYTGYKAGVWNTWPLYDLFVYCVDGRVLAVDRCIGAYRFDYNLERCVPHCPYAGLFPRDDDCANYYRCSPATTPAVTATSFVIANLTCPQGQGFLESAYQCVDRSLVPNCITNNPGLFNRK